MEYPSLNTVTAGAQKNGFRPWTDVADPRDALQTQDPEIFAIIERERRRQIEGIELIASENYVSPAVLAATGSILTNKYAEGLPGKRYYSGCKYIDEAEQVAIDRACQLFGAEHANVQPHAGAQANLAAYLAVLQPGDTVLAMKLDQGGHLTHGSNTNASGQLYHFVHYGVDHASERIDYDQAASLAEEHRPKLIVAGASSYPRIIDFPRLRQIADSVGARLMVDIAHIGGLVAAGLHPSPIPDADIVTVTTHKTLRGPRGGLILCKSELGKIIDRAVFPGTQGGPLEHAIAAKAVAFGEALRPEFKFYQQAVLDNMQALATELSTQGFRLVSGGTDNHLALADLTGTGVTGRQLTDALNGVGIHANKNVIPYDPLPPTVTSGLRVGSAACTTRGFGSEEFRQVGRWIGEVAHHIDDQPTLARVAEEVRELACRFPVPA
jgi:glycine hydroxymethyltransferase